MVLATTAQVRERSGIKSDITEDTVITNIISDVEEKTLSYFKIFSTPEKIVEIRDGNGKNEIVINRPYIWKVLELKTQNDTIDLENVYFNPISSIITVDNTQNPYYFYRYQNSVKIKYLSAFMEKTTSITESTSDVVAGSSVDIAVEDETIFSVDDWVLVEGLDGKREAAQITATDTNEITVDLLVQDHESESLITKLDTHKLLKEFILYESAVATGINAIGGSYTFNTSYSLGSLNLNKGVPYPHFEKNVNENTKQRDAIKTQILSKLNPIS